jgi:hypothetical protein
LSAGFAIPIERVNILSYNKEKVARQLTIFARASDVTDKWQKYWGFEGYSADSTQPPLVVAKDMAIRPALIWQAHCQIQQAVPGSRFRPQMFRDGLLRSNRGGESISRQKYEKIIQKQILEVGAGRGS